MKTQLIGGVVVLYEPQKEYLLNIDSYLNQVHKLIIFDNSITINAWLLDFLTDRNKIVYKSFQRNLGIAFALNYAADFFIKSGYKFLLTMDQDSKATPDMVNKLYNVIKDNNDIGIISPYHLNKLNTHKIPEVEIEEKLVVMTSGNLLNLKAYKEVGPFKNEFFIDYVDTEYCMRLKMNNYRIIRVNSALIYHNEANVSKKSLIKRIVYPYNHSPKRMYFKVRNRFYLRDIYKKIFPDYFNYEFPLFRNMLLKIILFENKKIKKIKFAIKGFIDYKRNITFSPFD